MKILNLVFLVFLLAGGVVAQTSLGYPEAPGVAVIKNSWHTKARDRMLEADPLNPSNEHGEKERYRKYQEERNAAVSVPSAIQPPPIWREPTTSRPMVAYFFEATISNTGTKKIRRLIWEYVFLSRRTGREVGYRPFVSQESISPGKSKQLVGIVVAPLANIADGAKAGQETRGRYIERVFIRQIEYDDNTVWQRPSR